MSIWKRLKNLWYLSGLSWNTGNLLPKHAMNGQAPQPAIIVDPQNILDKIDLT